jgi:hypothetical protein
MIDLIFPCNDLLKELPGNHIFLVPFKQSGISNDFQCKFTIEIHYQVFFFRSS